MSTQSSHLRLVADNGPHTSMTPVAEPREIIVAIPVLNEINHIEACVESLMQGDERLGEVRFVIADGGSTDGTRGLLDDMAERYPNLSWIDNPDRLQSAGVNAVAALAQHETILVRCDAHSIYPPGYITEGADALLRRRVASIVVPMDAVGESCFQKANAWVVDTPLGSGGSAHRGGLESKYVDHGHHAGFDLSVFRAVGGYDPSFSHNEDAEYDTRVARFGGRIYLDAHIRLAYKPRATPWSLARQYFNYGKGRARTIRKHAIRPRPRQMFPVLNLLALAGCAALAPILPVWWVYPAFYASILLGASLYLAMKHGSICGLMAGPAAAIMHVSWALGLCRQLLKR